MKNKTCGKIAVLAASLLLVSCSAWGAATASDTASNYAPSSWGSFTPANLGTGFGGWFISGSGASYGTYLSQTSYGDGDGVLYNGYGWGTYANGSSSTEITIGRQFSNSADGISNLVNQTLSFGLSSVGIGGSGQSLGVDVGGAFGLEYAGGGGDNMSLSIDGGTYNPIGVNFSDLNGGLLVSLAVSGPANSPTENYTLTIQAFNGGAGGTTYYSTSGTYNAQVYGTSDLVLMDDDTTGNGYFNNLNISPEAVPEPSSLSIMAMSGLGALLMFRRRK